MRLRWCGTAAVELCSGGYRLVIDPFLGMAAVCDAARQQRLQQIFTAADAVLVTHGHFDHIYDIPALYADRNIPVYATATPCAILIQNGLAHHQLVCIAPGEQLHLGPFTVTALRGRHCRFDIGVVCKTLFKKAAFFHPLRLVRLLRLNRRYPENGETLFYQIEAEGVRIQVMGSMGLDAAVAYPTGADVLILPFQGTGNPALTVAPIVDRLRPRSIFLDHYDDAFPPLSSQIPTAGFVSAMRARGIPTTATVAEEIYTLGDEMSG